MKINLIVLALMATTKRSKSIIVNRTNDTIMNETAEQ